MYLFYYLALFIAIFFAAIFSALETSMVSISEHRLFALKKKHVWARFAYKLKSNLNSVLIFSLFGNSLFNAIFTTLSAYTFDKLLVDVPTKFLLPIVTLFITCIIIIFSEALPKIIAARLPDQTLKVIIIPCYFLFYLSRPIVWLINSLINGIISLLKIKKQDKVNMEELKAIVSDARMPLTSKHRKVLLNSMELEQLTIKEVLIPIRMIEAIDIKDDLEINKKKIQTSNYTRIIVYRNSIENIMGFIHSKDILMLESNNNFTIEGIIKIIRPISFIGGFLSIIKQIHIAQKNRERIFLVINEHGDIIGIACLEDMLELIFGDFTTNAPQQQLMVKNSLGQLIVHGTMLIRKLNELIDLQITSDSEAITINGLILKILKSTPSVGICFRINGVIFEIISIGEYWAERIRITIPRNTKE